MASEGSHDQSLSLHDSRTMLDAGLDYVDEVADTVCRELTNAYCSLVCRQSRCYL